MESSKKKLIIVGAGFAGLRLFHLLKKHFIVKILDFKDFFEYTPEITAAISDKKFYKKLTLSYREVLKDSFSQGGLV